MSYSISAAKAKATHDTAMSIIEKEARDRASRTAHLRQLRLAKEAEIVDQIVVATGAKARARNKSN
jgi:hypothetical protein